MSSATKPVFRSTGQRGFTAAVSGDPRHIAARLGVVAGAKALDVAPHPSRVKAAIQSAIALILEEHQDWHMLVRPHRLPLG